MTTGTSQPESPSRSAPTWSSRKRLIVTAWLALHLLALIAAPLAGPPPSSSLARSTAGSLEWYIRPMFLGHGYRFFAPNPGPSHLLRYEVVVDDGEPVTGHFPNLDDQWPRLLYHRMFMLSETIHNITIFVEEDQFQSSIEAGKQEVKFLRSEGFHRQADRLDRDLINSQYEYERNKETRQALLDAVAARLAQQHNGREVRLYSQEHLIPTPLDVELGMQLDDPNLMEERLVHVWERPAE